MKLRNKVSAERCSLRMLFGRMPRVLTALLLLPLLMLTGPGDAASAAAPAGAARRLEIGLAQCVEGYIAGSDAVRTAEKKAGDSAEAHKRAVAEKKAALSLAELETAAQSAQLALAEARNNAALQAVQAYAGLAQAARDAQSRHASLAVAEEKLRVLRLRHQAGLITGDTVLQQENAYLSAKDAVIRADDSLRQAKDDLCRAMAVDAYEEIVLTTDVASLANEAVTYDVAECTVLARAASSSYFSAVKSEELARRKHEALQDTMIAAKAERASAEDALNDAADRLASAEKSVSDSVSSALAQLDSVAGHVARPGSGRLDGVDDDQRDDGDDGEAGQNDAALKDELGAPILLLLLFAQDARLLSRGFALLVLAETAVAGSAVTQSDLIQGARDAVSAKMSAPDELYERYLGNTQPRAERARVISWATRARSPG